MKRLPNWQPLLAAQIEKAQHSKFEWGVFDCALAACDAALAITGEDPGAPYRGKYKTEAEANALIGSGNGALGTFAATIAASIGAKEVPKLFARRGDIVLVRNAPRGRSHHPLSTALGFVDLSGRSALCASEKGLARVPMDRWLRAWRIG
jgi:uncharacterized protein DUF6950